MDELKKVAREMIDAAQHHEDARTMVFYKRFEEIADLMQARIDELSKDAARYRWLRDQHWSDKGMCVMEKAENARLGSFCPSGDLLDATIDAAMKD